MKPTKQELKLLNCLGDSVDDLVFWSFRYFLGRQSIAAYGFSGDLAKAWPFLADKSKIMIKRELTEEFERDNRARQLHQEKQDSDPKCDKYPYFPLGQDCDRAGWLRVLEAAEAHEAALRAESGNPHA